MGGRNDKGCGGVKGELNHDCHDFSLTRPLWMPTFVGMTGVGHPPNPLTLCEGGDSSLRSE